MYIIYSTINFYFMLDFFNLKSKSNSNDQNLRSWNFSINAVNKTKVGISQSIGIDQDYNYFDYNLL